MNKNKSFYRPVYSHLPKRQIIRTTRWLYAVHSNCQGKHWNKRIRLLSTEFFFSNHRNIMASTCFFPSLYSACPGGLYGQYCSKSCGNCLQNTTCNHGNGTCLDGCDAGYKGKYCTTRRFDRVFFLKNDNFSYQFIILNLKH